MKYIVLWHDFSNVPIQTSNANLCLGHEIYSLRPSLILMLLDGQISKDDIIVTSEQRRFLYTKIFNKVLSYEEFKKEYKNNDEVLHLYKHTINEALDSYMTYNRGRMDLKYYPKDFYEIFLNSFELDDIKEKENFIVVHFRSKEDLKEVVRKHEPEVNDIINAIPENFGVFVFVEKKFEHLVTNPRVKFVNKLKDYVSLCASEKCLFVIGTLSGGTQISSFVSKNVIEYFSDLPYGSVRGIYNASPNGIVLRDAFDETKNPKCFLYKFNYHTQVIEFIKLGGLNENTEISKKIYKQMFPKIFPGIYYPPDDFDPIKYLYLNKDLRQRFGWSKIQAYIHYVTVGWRENRPYQTDKKIEIEIPDFDWQRYINDHKDLYERLPYTRYHARLHLIMSGINENREFYFGKYRGKDIDWEKYYNKRKEYIDRYFDICGWRRNTLHDSSYSQEYIGNWCPDNIIHKSIRYYLELGMYNGDIIIEEDN